MGFDQPTKLHFTHGTLKWLKLIYQKIPKLSEFVIRVNMDHYKNQISMPQKKIFIFSYYARN